MHHPEADEFGLLETGNQAQHARLFAPFDLRLEADQAEVIAGQVVLPELDDGVRRLAGARIDEADRLHRSEAQRVAAAVRHHLDRQAAFEESLLVEVVHGGRFRVRRAHRRSARTRRASSGNSGSRPRHRRRRRRARRRPSHGVSGFAGPSSAWIRLCRRTRRHAPPPSRRAEDLVAVDRLGQDDRADRVVEVQVILPDQRRERRPTAPRTSADRSRR